VNLAVNNLLSRDEEGEDDGDDSQVSASIAYSVVKQTDREEVPASVFRYPVIKSNGKISN
jgi:hypothetical protein